MQHGRTVRTLVAASPVARYINQAQRLMSCKQKDAWLYIPTIVFRQRRWGEQTPPSVTTPLFSRRARFPADSRFAILLKVGVPAAAAGKFRTALFAGAWVRTGSRALPEYESEVVSYREALLRKSNESECCLENSSRRRTTSSGKCPTR